MENRNQGCTPPIDVALMELQEGDVVRLAGSVTRAEFGLALCDDDGEMLEIDGVVSEVLPQWVKITIRRMVRTVSFCAPVEGAVMRLVRPHEVLEVIDGEARLWPNAAALKGVSNERDGKARKAATGRGRKCESPSSAHPRRSHRT